MRRYANILALAVCLFSLPAFADSDVWHGGGSYDGYDQNSISSKITPLKLGTVIMIR